ncbi:MAG: hypothetical protein BWZ10_03288 [candidate division BRC1 bacterium ADurb.BinA364]|nr:MAG: hypothetical protein BWZ10_03288 [candidate division BRC1 bacterium ADurb.BinA364]
MRIGRQGRSIDNGPVCGAGGPGGLRRFRNLQAQSGFRGILEKREGLSRDIFVQLVARDRRSALLDQAGVSARGATAQINPALSIEDGRLGRAGAGELAVDQHKMRAGIGQHDGRRAGGALIAGQAKRLHRLVGDLHARLALRRERQMLECVADDVSIQQHARLESLDTDVFQQGDSAELAVHFQPDGARSLACAQCQVFHIPPVVADVIQSDGGGIAAPGVDRQVLYAVLEGDIGGRLIGEGEHGARMAGIAKRRRIVGQAQNGSFAILADDG